MQAPGRNHSLACWEPGEAWEGGVRRRRGSQRSAQSAKRGHLRSLDREHRSSHHTPGQWGTPHRKVTATRRLYIISSRSARHLPGTLPAAPESCHAGNDRPPGNPGGETRRDGGAESSDARDRELATESQDGRDEGSRDAAAAREPGRGTGSGSRTVA